MALDASSVQARAKGVLRKTRPATAVSNVICGIEESDLKTPGCHFERSRKISSNLAVSLMGILLIQDDVLSLSFEIARRTAFRLDSALPRYTQRASDCSLQPFEVDATAVQKIRLCEKSGNPTHVISSQV